MGRELGVLFGGLGLGGGCGDGIGEAHTADAELGDLLDLLGKRWDGRVDDGALLAIFRL